MWSNNTSVNTTSCTERLGKEHNLMDAERMLNAFFIYRPSLKDPYEASNS